LECYRCKQTEKGAASFPKEYQKLKIGPCEKEKEIDLYTTDVSDDSDDSDNSEDSEDPEGDEEIVEENEN